MKIGLSGHDGVNKSVRGILSTTSRGGNPFRPLSDGVAGGEILSVGLVRDGDDFRGRRDEFSRKIRLMSSNERKNY